MTALYLITLTFVLLCLAVAVYLAVAEHRKAERLRKQLERAKRTDRVLRRRIADLDPQLPVTGREGRWLS